MRPTRFIHKMYIDLRHIETLCAVRLTLLVWGNPDPPPLPPPLILLTSSLPKEVQQFYPIWGTLGYIYMKCAPIWYMQMGSMCLPSDKSWLFSQDNDNELDNEGRSFLYPIFCTWGTVYIHLMYPHFRVRFSEQILIQ